MHSDRASGPLSREAQRLSEVSGKRRKTEADIVELARREFHCSIYLDAEGRPTLPVDNLHSCFCAAARRPKEGPMFSGSLTVSSVRFDHDGPDEPDALWAEQERFVDRRSVKIGMSRVIRTRAVFPEWSLTMAAEHDPESRTCFIFGSGPGSPAHGSGWAIIVPGAAGRSAASSPGS